MTRRTNSKGRAAMAAVEFAVVLIILLPLLMGVWEVGRLVNVEQTIMNAAREAGRQASTGERTADEIRAITLNYLQKQGLSKLTAVATQEADLTKGGKVFVGINVYDTSGNLVANADPKADAKQNYKITITVKVLFNDVEYSPTNYFLGNTATVSAVASWNCMKDIPLQVNDTIPLY